MHWTEPATADDSHSALEKKLWDTARALGQKLKADFNGIGAFQEEVAG